MVHTADADVRPRPGREYKNEIPIFENQPNMTASDRASITNNSFWRASGGDTFIISSAQRQVGTFYDGVIGLSDDLNIDNCKLSLLYASIPDTSYTFDNDKFTFQDEGGPVLEITLHGSFTPATFAPYLECEMNAISSGLSRPSRYTVGYSNVTGKLTIGISDNDVGGLSIGPWGTPSETAAKLGIWPDSPAGPGHWVTMPNIMNLQPPSGCIVELLNVSIGPKGVADRIVRRFFVPSESRTMVDYHKVKIASTKIASGNPFMSNRFHYDGLPRNGAGADSIHLPAIQGARPTRIRYRLLNPIFMTPLKVHSDWYMILRIDN